MAIVDGQKIKADSSRFKVGTRQPVVAIGSQQRYPVLSRYRVAIRLPVVGKGNDQRYPPLSRSKNGLRIAVPSLGTKLIVAEAATSIRKVTKLFGQLFP